jgi:serine/threonine protein kinase, bacterial
MHLKAIFLFLIIPIIGKSQIITTFVGTGAAGCSGSDSLGIHCAVNDPNGLVFSKGFMYFADEGCGKVCKVDISGFISIFAGGGSGGDGVPATSSNISLPNAVAADPKGNIYIVDGGFKIRKVDIITNIISTYAGIGS